jgi:hypothetical protein
MARSRHVPDVMLALFQAKKCTKLATFGDIPPEDVAVYRQIAEAAVMMIAEPNLREAAEYFAAHQVSLEHDIDFLQLPVEKRWRVVQDVRVVLRKFFAFMRGEYPAALETYREKFQVDKRTIQERQAANRAQFAKSQRENFSVVPGGVQ